MGYRAEVIADSISPAGHRLTTMVVSYPRFILAEMGTHRSFSKNTASSRAVPVEKMIESVEDDPFEPEEWPINQAGMSSVQNLSKFDKPEANFYWTEARQNAIKAARALARMKVHKQIVNRLLEPFSWTTQIISATEWDNFFELRCSSDAQPEMQKIANMMRESYEGSIPLLISTGEWHNVLVSEEDDTLIRNHLISTVGFYNISSVQQTLNKVSAGRAARVSYLTHDGKRDIIKDLELFDRLKNNKHYSPFEHIATPCDCLCYLRACEKTSNFKGYHQFRWDVERGRLNADSDRNEIW